MADQKRVVIIGLGFAGMRAFRELASNKLAHVIAIDPKDYFSNTTDAVFCLVDKSADAYMVDYSSNKALSAHFTQGLVKNITSDGTTGSVTVKLADGRVEDIAFDYAIIGTGSSYGSVKPPITDIHNKTQRSAECAKEHQQLLDAENIIVVGAGAVGVEAAAVIAETFPGKAITIIAFGTRVLDKFDTKASEYAEKWLSGKGVTIVYSQRVTDWAGVESAPGVATIQTSTGHSYTGLVIKCVGGKPETAAFAASSTMKLTASGAVVVNNKLQVEDMPNVFAAGDVASSPEEKTANYADYAGWAAAINVLAAINGKELQDFPAGLFKGQSKLPFASGAMLGKKEGIMQIGTDVQVGGMVASMKGFFGPMILGSARGSWFKGWLYRFVKSMFVGQLVSAGKKEAAALAAAN